MDVVWKKIDGYDYELSSSGQVRNLNKKVLRNRNGDNVTVKKDGKQCRLNVKALLCQMFPTTEWRKLNWCNYCVFLLMEESQVY